MPLEDFLDGALLPCATGGDGFQAASELRQRALATTLDKRLPAVDPSPFEQRHAYVRDHSGQPAQHRASESIDRCNGSPPSNAQSNASTVYQERPVPRKLMHSAPSAVGHVFLLDDLFRKGFDRTVREPTYTVVEQYLAQLRLCNCCSLQLR